MPFHSTGQRVLVVDDQHHCTELLEQLLTPDGFAVDVAADGESALIKMNMSPPDLVLLDVGLPGIDGIEVCKMIKQTETTRLTPVILLTGMSGREHRLAGIHAGADDFLAKPFDLEQLRARVRSLTRLKSYTDELDSAESVIMSLALTVEARDPYTEGHCDRLAKYAVSLGAALGLGKDDLAALKRGGFLHDVGKIGVPDSILLKAHPLTPDEYDAIKLHPEIGERLLGDLRSLAPVRPIVRHHHERLDGSGYPDGLRGAEVPLLAHIVSIVDAYDAMTTARPYRQAMPQSVAISELRRDVTRGRMSRDLVEMFIAVLDGRRLDKTA
ncbi:MAG TPA: HD domain-containing phosphohydrolase [Vicinamibacterales bacterium]|nr:HD domain-containing phosphohydrolase [Vicinamibacterales bacterium]